MIATAILGAGFSYAAGLPLTKYLFDCDSLPLAFTDRSVERHTEVLAAWRKWSSQRVEPNAEEWLRLLYEKHPLEFFEFGTTWENALDFAMARLVRLPRRSNKAPYYHGITTSVASEAHRMFWQKLRGKYQLRSVVTLNYDILAEQGLKATYSKHRTAPLCHYGGFPRPQKVRKMTNVAKGEFEEVDLGEEIALFKLHGSINWVIEPHAPDTQKIHDDVRAVFRETRELGVPRIIPPVPEKERPEWLSEVWRCAEDALRMSQLWFVCGYSLPEYDEPVRDLFSKASRRAFGLRIIIADPFAEAVKANWERIVPKGTEFRLLSGLPECLKEI